MYDGTSGQPIETLINGFPEPTGMAIGPDGSLYVASIALDAVHRFDGSTGALIEIVVSSGAGGLSAATFVALLIDPLGDVDGDGTVGVDDLVTLLAAWGPCPDPPAGCAADLDDDGDVDVDDLLTLILNWTT